MNLDPRELFVPMKPSIGHIVHYVPSHKNGEKGTCHAAIITAVGEAAGKPAVALFILDTLGTRFMPNVPHEDDAMSEPEVEAWGAVDLVRGTWHWPERV